MARTEAPLRASRLLILAAVCVTVAALYFARDVLIPLALAMLVSFLLTPLVVRLERAGLPRIPAVLVVFISMLAVVAVLGWVVYVQVEDLADQLPRYQGEITAKIRSFVGTERGAFGKAAEAIEGVGRAVAADQEKPSATQPGSTQPADALTNLLSRLDERFTEDPEPLGTRENPIYVQETPQRRTLADYLSAYAPSAAAVAATGGIVLVFVLFILFTREDLRDRLIRLIGYGQLHMTTQALDDAATRISRYLTALAIVNGTYGIGISIGLWLIGYLIEGETFPNFVLWGLLCALLRFIPYVGPWIAASFPIALSFALFPGYQVFVAVCLMFIIVEVLSNNFMEPWLYGSSTGMTTVAVLVAAVFWTWLWGPIGLVMATPLTVCLVVIGKYVPQLQFFDILLGDEPVLSPSERVYQRLLAMDQEEAMERVEAYRQEMSLEQIYDDVLLPTLALAEQDRHAERLDEGRGQFIRNALRQMIEELGDEERLAEVRAAAESTERRARGDDSDAAEEQAKPARVRVPEGLVVNALLLPAHDPADEIVASMLAQLLELRGYCAVSVSQNALASEMIGEVERTAADVVIVSALPPAAVAHARYLCKRLHGRYPEINTVVGLWTVRGDLKKARERILCSDNVKLATSFDQALQLIHEMVQPKLLAADAQAGAPAK